MRARHAFGSSLRATTCTDSAHAARTRFAHTQTYIMPADAMRPLKYSSGPSTSIGGPPSRFAAPCCGHTHAAASSIPKWSNSPCFAVRPPWNTGKELAQRAQSGIGIRATDDGTGPAHFNENARFCSYDLTKRRDAFRQPTRQANAMRCQRKTRAPPMSNH